MLLGAVALFAGLAGIFSPPDLPRAEVPSLMWDAGATEARLGEATLIDDRRLRIKLNANRISVVSMPQRQFDAKSYPYLHIALTSSSADLKLTILWQETDEAGVTSQSYYNLENELHQSLWLATSEIKGWQGKIDSLYLMTSGKPGDTAVIEDFSLYTFSLTRQLRAIYSDFAAYVPWNRAAMNSHTGVTKVSSFYPVPLIVAYLSLSLLAYILILLIWRSRLGFDWRVVALIFLTCWFVLDFSWQYRLLNQLADTQRTFAGKSTTEKLAIGPDAELYNFVSTVKSQLEPENARIFVASSDEYTGLRSAYYLYPYNVFWSLRGKELPHSKFIRRGDYILTVKPTSAQYGSVKQILAIPGAGATAAELLFSEPAGTLYKVK